MSAKCFHCGADEALHMAGPVARCPQGGREAPVSKRQEWDDTVYLDGDQERIRRAAPDLLAVARAAADLLSGYDTTPEEDAILRALWEAIAQAEGS